MSYASKPRPSDVVSIAVGTQTLSGWVDVRVTRGIERCPSDFVLRVTEHYPTEPSDIVITPGDPCQVRFGTDPIITGYVDRYAAQIGVDSHTVTISGRSKVADLVDCSGKMPAQAASSITMVGLATKLAAPFGIKVQAPDGDSSVIPTFNVTLSETPFEILEPIARWAQFFTLENEVILDAARLSGMRAAQRGKRSGTVTSIAASMPKAHVRHNVPGMPFGFAIKLPNVAPGNCLWKQDRNAVVPPNLGQFR